MRDENTSQPHQSLQQETKQPDAQPKNDEILADSGFVAVDEADEMPIIDQTMTETEGEYTADFEDSIQTVLGTKSMGTSNPMSTIH